jgi:hypothetical protein
MNGYDQHTGAGFWEQGCNRFIRFEDPDKVIDPTRSGVISWNRFLGGLQSPEQ